MSTYSTPNSQGQTRQVNSGDISGEIWGTMGIDLSTSPGKILSSRRMARTISASTMANKDTVAMTIYKGNIHAFGVQNSRSYIQAYRNPRISGNWSNILGGGGSLNDITDGSDAIVFDGKLLVSTDEDIASTTDADGGAYDIDWWTNVVSGTALTATKPHIMDVSRIGAETLFVTDGNVVRYYNTTAGHTAITLASQLTACCLATDAYATWVGTYSNAGDAYVYEIYIGEDIARNSYKIDGTAVLSMDVIDGVVFIVTDRGHIQQFNGRAFVTVNSFPFADKGVTLQGLGLGNISDSNIERAIHPKGMRAYGKKLEILINTNNQLIEDLGANPIDDDDIFENYVVDERSPSGVWEYDTETNVLNHKYSLTYDSTTQGYHRIKKSGPILILDNQYTKLLVAGRVEDDVTHIYAEDPTTSPLATLITPEYESESITEAYARVVSKLDTLVDGDSVEIKYRVRKKDNYPKYAIVNWLTDTEFTFVGDLSDVDEGDECEIMDGTGAGLIAHVASTPTTSSTTYTVALDSAIGNTGGVSTVRFQNWKMIDSAITKADGEFKTVGTDESNTWVQFKLVYRGLIKMRKFISKGNKKIAL